MPSGIKETADVFNRSLVDPYSYSKADLSINSSNCLSDYEME